MSASAPRVGRGGPGRRPPWIALIALLLLAVALASLALGTAADRRALLGSLERLLPWLPLLYGVVALSYGGRYWRWRLLLGRLGIGRLCRADLAGWLRGFALTATPAKLGELARVQQLHRQLGYPRAPLVHVFVAERIADVTAVAALLLLLAPGQVLARLPPLPWSAPVVGTLLLVTPVAVAAGLLLLRRSQRSGVSERLRRWRHHLPSGSLARATWPAALISVLVWANEALVLWLLVGLLSPTAITIPAAISIYLLSGSAGMASTLPGGIGVNEATTVLLLGQQGIGPALALPIAVLRRIITLWSMVALAAAIGVFWPIPAVPSGGVE